MERWPRWLYDDGDGRTGIVQARNATMALGIIIRTAGGHHAIRDTDGEDDEREHHDCRRCGWECYLIVDDRGQLKDWIAITRLPVEDAPHLT